VPEDTWRAVDAILRDPTRLTHLSSARKWLGGGLYWCGVEGCTAHVRAFASASTTRNRGKPQYVCASGVKHLARACTDVDEFVEALVIRRLSAPDAAALVDRPDRPDTGGLHVQALALRLRLDELAGMFADGSIDARQLREGSGRIRAQLNDVERQIADAAAGSALSGLIGVDDPAATWAGLHLDRRRAVIDELVVVTLLPAAKGRPRGWRPGSPYFRPDSVRVEWRRAGA
jgi:site-specific DNA recombinase